MQIITHPVSPSSQKLSGPRPPTGSQPEKLAESSEPTESLDLSKPGDQGQENTFWRNLFSGELFEIGQRLTPEHLRTTAEAAQSVGTALRDVWSDLKSKVGEVLNLPEVEQRFSPEAREKALETVVQVARGLGYAAAGVQGIGGIYKLKDGFKKNSTERKLDGVFDLTTSAAVGTAIAGLGAVPLVLGPLAATLGVVRGGYNAVTGFAKGDTRAEVQGALDATRSASIGFRLLGNQVALLGTVGAVLAPIAGAIQFGRGLVDLSSGLAEEKKDKQVQGLSDIATAVGLTASLTGIGTIPGLALVATAMGGRVLYQFNEKFQGLTDQKLDDWQPQLQTAVDGVEKVTKPILNAGRALIKKATGRSKGDGQDAPLD